MSYELSSYYQEASKNASTFDTTNFSEDTKRQMASLYSVSLDDEEKAELEGIISQMGLLYATYQVRYYSLTS